MEELKKMYCINSKSEHEDEMKDYVKAKAEEYGGTVTFDDYGNMYVTKGESETYPCLCAHLDEVHEKRPKWFEVFEHKRMIYALTKGFKNYGIGADDKNGVWIALQCLKKYDCIKISFFVEEEIGCLGSMNSNLEFFKDCRFVVECDRRGSFDFISEIYGTSLCSEEFKKDVDMDKFGYFESSGLMTDVLQLVRNGVGISCCNLSCGYYNPHTREEFTITTHLQNCLDFVCHIIEKCTKVYPL